MFFDVLLSAYKLKGCGIMKRVIGVILVLLMTFIVFENACVIVNADNFNYLKFKLNGDSTSYCVSDCSVEATGDIVIPSIYNGLPVTTIDPHAFYECNSIRNVIIPDGVISIGTNAFYGCTVLNSVVIPNTVKNIGKYAFESCTSLTSVNIPNGITTVNESTFKDCVNLKNIVIPNSVLSIEDYAFYNCTNLESIEFGENVLVIGDESFARCVNLKSVVFPNSLTTIGRWCFYFCLRINYLTFGNSVSCIGSGAFESCNSIQKVYYKCNSYVENYYFYSGEKIELHPCFSDWITDTNTTVNSPGSKHKECTECGEVLETAVIPQLKCATPKLTKATNTANGVKVTWDAVEGADSYRVYRRAGGVLTWSYIGTTTTNTFTDAKATNNKYWIYTVIAVNEAGYSGFDKVGKTIKCVTAPKVTGVSNAANGLYVKWNAVPGAKEYRVYRKGLNYNSWLYLGTTKNTWFIDSPIKNSNGYYYKYTVIAVNDYCSGFYEDCAFTKRLSNPVLKSAVSSKTGITVKWNSVYGSTGYYVYRKTANFGWTLVGSTKGANSATYIDKTAKKGVTYTYTVRAYHGKTFSSYNSGISCKDKY